MIDLESIRRLNHYDTDALIAAGRIPKGKNNEWMI